MLGHGYLARRKSFKKLNHALQCVYLASIMRADFNTDCLRLERRARNLDFDGELLQAFKERVLAPLKEELSTLPERAYEGRLYPEGSRQPNYLDDISWVDIPAYDRGWFSELHEHLVHNI